MMIPGSTIDYFRYYFVQQEAVETVIWLYEVAKVQSPQDLMKFDSSDSISEHIFEEDWKPICDKNGYRIRKNKGYELAVGIILLVIVPFIAAGFKKALHIDFEQPAVSIHFVVISKKYKGICRNRLFQ